MRAAWVVLLLLVPIADAQVILQDGVRDAQGRAVPAADLETIRLGEDRDHVYVTVHSDNLDQLSLIGNRPTDAWVQVEGGFRVEFGQWNRSVHFRATASELRAWVDGQPISEVTGNVRTFTVALAKESFFGDTHMWPGTSFRDAWAFVNVTSPVGSSSDPGDGGDLNASLAGTFSLDAWEPYGEDFPNARLPDLYALQDHVLIAFYQDERVMAGTWQDAIDVADRGAAAGSGTGVAIAGTTDWSAVAYYAEREKGAVQVSFKGHPHAAGNTTAPLEALGISDAEGPWRVPDLTVAQGVLYGTFASVDGIVLAKYTDGWEHVATYGDAHIARLATAPDGSVHVLTLSSADSAAQRVVYHADNVTVDVGTLDRSFDDRMGDEQGGFALAVDAAGRPHVAWDDGSAPKMAVVRDGSLVDTVELSRCPGGNPCNDMVMTADGNGYVTASGGYGGFTTIWMRTPYGTVIDGPTPPDSNAYWNEMAMAATPDGKLWATAIARNALVWSTMEPQHPEWMVFSLSSNGTVAPALPAPNGTSGNTTTETVAGAADAKRSPTAAPWLAVGLVVWATRRRR